MILDAALKMFSRYGYEACDVDQIAAYAGIGKGTIYRHFPSKENLFISLIDRGYALLNERMIDIAECMEEIEDINAALKDIITKELTLYVDFFIDNPEYYRVMMIERPELRLRLDGGTIKGHSTHIGRKVNRVRESIRAGLLADLDPSFMAYCYLGIAGAIVERRLYGKRNSLKKDVRNAVTLLLNGCLPKDA